MSLKHVVLALVSEEECHGYRIHERATELLSLASPRETSRVYGVLVDLEAAGLDPSPIQTVHGSGYRFVTPNPSR